MPLKKGFNDATRKGTHNFGASPPPPPVHDPLVDYKDSTSIKSKSTGDFIEDSSGVNDQTPKTKNQCSINHLGLIDTVVGEN